MSVIDAQFPSASASLCLGSHSRYMASGPTLIVGLYISLENSSPASIFLAFYLKIWAFTLANTAIRHMIMVSENPSTRRSFHSEVVAMSPNDTVAYTLLIEALGDDQPASSYRDHWSDTGDYTEGFAEFLVRQDVFVPDAPKAVDMVRRGYLKIEGRSLLASRPEPNSRPSSSDAFRPATLPTATASTRIISKSDVTETVVVRPDVAANREFRPDLCRANAEATGDASTRRSPSGSGRGSGGVH